jgi:hypothetical protein
MPAYLFSLFPKRVTRWRLFFRASAAGAASVLLFCTGGIEPADPTGIAVWADDCSSIVCAVNNADFDGRPLMGHSTNERYDIILYDAAGKLQSTLVSGRQIDGYASSVEEIYHMKTRGYLLVKSLMYNCGGRRFEKIALNGTITRLDHVACDAAADNARMVPSPQGTYIARVRCPFSSTV